MESPKKNKPEQFSLLRGLDPQDRGRAKALPLPEEEEDQREAYKITPSDSQPRLVFEPIITDDEETLQDFRRGGRPIVIEIDGAAVGEITKNTAEEEPGYGVYLEYPAIEARPEALALIRKNHATPGDAKRAIRRALKLADSADHTGKTQDLPFGE